jgi:hypothetical protein
VYLAIDPGVWTGAVYFQVVRGNPPVTGDERVHIFADYLSEGKSAEENARSILEIGRELCGGRIDRTWADPASGARTAMGPTVSAEYERAGIRPLLRWPLGSVADGLALLESFLLPAVGEAQLILHPRCVSTAHAIENYRRAKRGGQWQDAPEDPQHPHEDLVDAIRGGLRAYFPEGRGFGSSLPRVRKGQVF